MRELIAEEYVEDRKISLEQEDNAINAIINIKT